MPPVTGGDLGRCRDVVTVLSPSAFCGVVAVSAVIPVVTLAIFFIVSAWLVLFFVLVWAV